MMSTRACGNCKKTVYVNEKMEAEGKWYHRPCFKCMAPNCNTSLTLRNFQVAALEGTTELDGMTGRPVKVLVCKEHVPMPKHSLTSDSLSIKHTTSAPKPTVSGIHRTIMGDRTKEDSSSSSSPKSVTASFSSAGKLHSPRSLDEGSHAPFLKAAAAAAAASTAHKKEDDEENKQKEKETHEDEHTSHSYSSTAAGEEEGGGGNTLPKFRNGRFVVETADPIVVGHKEAEGAQDVHKDDGSFRNIPVHHRDYEHPDSAETQDLSETHEKRQESHVISRGRAPGGSGSNEWDEGLEDNKQERIFTKKGSTTSTEEKTTESKKADESFSSKLMEQHRRRAGGIHDDDEKDSAVEDDEWDAAPTDDHSRREGAVM